MPQRSRSGCARMRLYNLVGHPDLTSRKNHLIYAASDSVQVVLEHRLEHLGC
jgi:hypothetical protein